MQQNNIISKLVISNPIQPYQSHKSSLSFSMEPISSHIKLKDCEGTFLVIKFCLISSIVSLTQNSIVIAENNALHHQALHNDPSYM